MKMNPYNMPQIIKETSDGYFHLSVLDDLLSQREIYCLGEIDADSAGSLILQLQYLAAQDPEAEITLYINSPGGSVADGLALYDIMQTIPFRYALCVWELLPASEHCCSRPVTPERFFPIQK